MLVKRCDVMMVIMINIMNYKYSAIYHRITNRKIYEKESKNVLLSFSLEKFCLNEQQLVLILLKKSLQDKSILLKSKRTRKQKRSKARANRIFSCCPSLK